ncbi:hypothetical protein D3C76_663170 [compost metagenome]|uniref:Fap system outer membrane protein n=1 Tax=Pseudomonas jinjuensis TaxID=198616 RepID=A0A1G9Z1U2_9PSED|nr:hypothetical protein [Pseudomonas jinjuensis]SDN14683.1 hypothetical protein SAMN05216193_101292 [Pseudomonas jinjuensis]
MKIITLLTVTCLAASIPAHGAGLFRPVELKDQELAQLRGRYVLPGRIISFGVVLDSTWKNASGERIGARASMQIQQSTVKPQFYVTTYKESGHGDALDGPKGSISGGGGLDRTQGVTQSVRAAGDYNTAYNNVDIDIRQGSQAPVPVQNGQPLERSISQSNGAGTVTISPGKGGIQLAINAGDQGSSLQRLGAGGLLQAANMAGVSNQVSNIAELSVVLRNGAGSTSLEGTLDQIRGLRAMGL